jgi:hypothetical protein
MAVDAGTPLGYPRAATAVTNAIRDAAGATGTSFSYLLATAKIESDLNPSLTMKSSSAAGLFQFIDQTWLGTLKQAGPAFGYGDYANAISRDSSGHYSVSDPQMRSAIMKLRNDPSANAVMAGVLTQNNAAVLTRRIGRQPTESELYIAHFLGAGGAGKLIQLTASNAQATAADVFPQAAHANRPIFYDRQGNARSISGVYSEIVRRFNIASAGSASMLASAAAHPARPAGVAASPVARAAIPVTDVAAITKAFATGSASPSAAPTAAAPVPPIAAAQAAPTFNSLFSDQDRRTAVDPMVVALWSVPADPPPGSNAPAAPQAAAAPAIKGTTGPASFDLFQDVPTNGRALFGGSS